MTEKTSVMAAFAAGALFASAAATSAAAQERIDVEVPRNDFVVDTSTRSGNGEFAGLPGVDTRDGIGKTGLRGPGGLKNNIGAIGTATPSTSSANPRPLQQGTTLSPGGIPLER